MTTPAFLNRLTFWSALGGLALSLMNAHAQTVPAGKAGPAPLAASCLPVAQLKATDLFGQWTVQFSNPPRGLPAQARMQLHRHAEFSESLAGMVLRNLGAAPGGKVPGHAPRAQLAGDIEGGAVMLDESSNGTNLTASWDGRVVEGSCGKLVEGLWKDLSSDALPDAPDVPFTLTRHGGW
jgi:hypothetical protein